MAAHYLKLIFLFALASIFLMSGCSHGDGVLPSEWTATLAPKSDGSFSIAASSVKEYLPQKNGYQVYVSTIAGYRGEYIEIKKNGQPLLDFVKIPNTNNYAMSFYDVSSLSATDIAHMKSAFEDNFLEVVPVEGRASNKVELKINFPKK